LISSYFRRRKFPLFRYLMKIDDVVTFQFQWMGTMFDSSEEDLLLIFECYTFTLQDWNLKL
jgi:hypothetical protein